MKDNRQRFEELLFDRILHGLEPVEEARFRELDRTFAADPGVERERQRLEEAAAALHLALLEGVEPLPGPLRQTLEARAADWQTDRPPTDLP